MTSIDLPRIQNFAETPRTPLPDRPREVDQPTQPAFGQRVTESRVLSMTPVNERRERRVQRLRSLLTALIFLAIIGIAIFAIAMT